MDFEFSADQEMLRDSVRRFLSDRAPLTYVREMYNDNRGTSDAVWNGLADLGLQGILVSEEFGGLAMGMVDMGVVLEEMGRAAHPGPFLASAVGAVSLADAELLAGLATGDLVGTTALVDEGARSPWAPPSTEAAEHGGTWSLTGVKTQVPDAAHADVILVTASVGERAEVFAVEREAPGVEVTTVPTTDGSRKQGSVALSGAPGRLVEGADIGRAVDRLLTALTVDGVGAASSALDLALAYANERVQFDRPIGSFQAIQHLCADMLRDLELARAGAYYALWSCDDGDPAVRHEAATMAKAWASDALVRVSAACIQVHGGIGFTWEHDAHLFHKRLLGLQHAFGGSTDHLEELARLVLD